MVNAASSLVGCRCWKSSNYLGSSVRQSDDLPETEKWLDLRILGGGVRFCRSPGTVREDRCRQILSRASPTVTPFSGCLEKLERFGMKRFSQNTEFLLHRVVVLKTSAHKRGASTNGINLNGDPLINVSLHVACSADLTEDWAAPPRSSVLILTRGRVGGVDRHWLSLLLSWQN